MIRPANITDHYRWSASSSRVADRAGGAWLMPTGTGVVQATVVKKSHDEFPETGFSFA
jgi:hypothetical protein